MAEKNKKILQDALSNFTKNLTEHVKDKYHKNADFKKLTEEYIRIHEQLVELTEKKAKDDEIESKKKELAIKRSEILQYHHENMNAYFQL